MLAEKIIPGGPGSLQSVSGNTVAVLPAKSLQTAELTLKLYEAVESDDATNKGSGRKSCGVEIREVWSRNIADNSIPSAPTRTVSYSHNSAKMVRGVQWTKDVVAVSVSCLEKIYLLLYHRHLPQNTSLFRISGSTFPTQRRTKHTFAFCLKEVDGVPDLIKACMVWCGFQGFCSLRVATKVFRVSDLALPYENGIRVSVDTKWRSATEISEKEVVCIEKVRANESFISFIIRAQLSRPVLMIYPLDGSKRAQQRTLRVRETSESYVNLTCSSYFRDYWVSTDAKRVFGLLENASLSVFWPYIKNQEGHYMTGPNNYTVAFQVFTDFIPVGAQHISFAKLCGRKGQKLLVGLTSGSLIFVNAGKSHKYGQIQRFEKLLNTYGLMKTRLSQQERDDCTVYLVNHLESLLRRLETVWDDQFTFKKNYPSNVAQLLVEGLQLFDNCVEAFYSAGQKSEWWSNAPSVLERETKQILYVENWIDDAIDSSEVERLYSSVQELYSKIPFKNNATGRRLLGFKNHLEQLNSELNDQKLKPFIKLLDEVYSWVENEDLMYQQDNENKFVKNIKTQQHNNETHEHNITKQIENSLEEKNKSTQEKPTEHNNTESTNLEQQKDSCMDVYKNKEDDNATKIVRVSVTSGKPLGYYWSNTTKDTAIQFYYCIQNHEIYNQDWFDTKTSSKERTLAVLKMLKIRIAAATCRNLKKHLKGVEQMTMEFEIRKKIKELEDFYEKEKLPLQWCTEFAEELAEYANLIEPTIAMLEEKLQEKKLGSYIDRISELSVAVNDLLKTKYVTQPVKDKALIEAKDLKSEITFLVEYGITNTNCAIFLPDLLKQVTVVENKINQLTVFFDADSYLLDDIDFKDAMAKEQQAKELGQLSVELTKIETWLNNYQPSENKEESVQKLNEILEQIVGYKYKLEANSTSEWYDINAPRVLEIEKNVHRYKNQAEGLTVEEKQSKIEEEIDFFCYSSGYDDYDEDNWLDDDPVDDSFDDPDADYSLSDS